MNYNIKKLLERISLYNILDDIVKVGAILSIMSIILLIILLITFLCFYLA